MCQNAIHPTAERYAMLDAYEVRAWKLTMVAIARIPTQFARRSDRDKVRPTVNCCDNSVAVLSASTKPTAIQKARAKRSRKRSVQ